MNITHSLSILLSPPPPPFEKGGAYCVAPVGPSVGMSVSLNLVQLVTQEGFAQEASNLVGR